MNGSMSGHMLERGLFILFSPILGVFFFGVVAVLRDIFSSFFLARLRLARGELGSPHSIRLFVAKWLLTISRLKCDFRADWIWFLILSLQTTTLALLPITGESIIHIERPSIILVLLALSTSVAATIGCWKGKLSAIPIEVTRQVQKSVVGIAALLLVLIGLSLGAGTEDFNQIVHRPFLAFQSPLTFVSMVLCFFLTPAIELGLPTSRKGRGLEVLVNSISEILWATLIVVVFLGALMQTPESIFIEIILKTSIFLVMSDVTRTFLSTMSYRLIERITLVVLFPVLLITAFHLLWKDLL